MDKEQKPKATQADFERREKLTSTLKEKWSEEVNDEFMEMMNSLDWDTEIIYEGDKCGLRNWRGEILLPPVFEDFGLLTGFSGKYREMNKGERVSARKDGKWGVVVADGTGTWIVDPIYDCIGYPQNLTYFCIDGRWGVFNIPEGRYLIEPVCDAVVDNGGSLFFNGIGFYRKDDKYGVIGSWGSFTEPIFEDYKGAPEGVVKVMYNGEWGYVTEEGSFTTECEEAYYYFND